PALVQQFICHPTDYDIWPRELADNYVADDLEVIRSGKTKKIEEPLVSHEGKRTWIETVKVPIFGDHGQVIGTTGLARDISERRLTEEMLRQSHAQLEQLVRQRTVDLEQLNDGLKIEIAAHQAARKERERLLKELERKNKELESIIYVTSHDLRSPLVNIQGFSKILEKNYQEMLQWVQAQALPEDGPQDAVFALTAKMARNVHFITTSVHKMDMLIEGLLRVSRLGLAELHVETIPMGIIFKHIVEAMTYQIHQAGATVEIGYVPDCRGDKIQIGQVFSNLVDNALKYRQDGRPLKIRITGEDREDHSVYCVEDNGIGIADEHQDKIWELFHRLNPDSRMPGEGLGLTMVRRTVDRNNGWVWVESALGEGSRFFVALPSAAPVGGKGLTVG
ncbi:MAG: ATP-binding protein, partial [Candidatus Omnitrophota bacterium]